MLIAPCGLNCAECDLFLAPTHPEIGQRLLAWFQKNGYPNAEISWFHCCGCPGTKEAHWSADCEIRACCSEQRGLPHCSSCPEFACQRLKDWAASGAKYAAALVYLKQIFELKP